MATERLGTELIILVFYKANCNIVVLKDLIIEPSSTGQYRFNNRIRLISGPDIGEHFFQAMHSFLSCFHNKIVPLIKETPSNQLTAPLYTSQCPKSQDIQL